MSILHSLGLRRGIGRKRTAAFLISFAFILAITGASAAPDPLHVAGRDLNKTLAGNGQPLPSGLALPSSSLAFPGIRPGSWMYSPNLCTMNFIFNSSGTMSGGGPFYIGTAKHCVQQQGGDVNARFDPNENVIGKEVTLAIAERLGSVPRLITIGRVAFATSGENRVGQDFALVRIDPSLESIISPSIAEIGGPTSVYHGTSYEPIVTTGHGLVIGTGGTTRSGVVTAYDRSYPHAYGMIIPVVPGDSGGPIRTAAGGAVGNVTNFAPSQMMFPAIAYGTRVTLVEQTWGLRVVTCSNGTPWALPGCPR